ncbi:MAG: DUF2207 domain-containing protein [Ruminococcaceae bacterium]|nr:DUF2207 domain-containing protein [Oscillospiraceae bacterium]
MVNAKYFKNVYLRLFTIILIVISLMGFLSLVASAKSGYEIYDIQINVKLNEDGSADITEVWDVEIDSSTNGTEWYLIKGYLNGSKISNFKVFENDREFAYVGDNWNINASRSQKAYKCGTTPNTDQEGLELCWGIGEYGRHKFTVSYHITEVVDAYSDKDGFNWRFVNDELSAIPQSVSVKITAPFDITEENARIWAFGNTGTIHFMKEDGQNGYIYATASGDEYNSYSSHMTIVSGFNKELFKPARTMDGTFEDLVETAKTGSSYDNNYEENSQNGWSNGLGGVLDFILAMLGKVFSVLMMVGMIFAFVVAAKRTNPDALPRVKVSSAEKKNVDYSREIPFNKNLEKTFAGLRCIGESKKNSDLISAYLLKWVNEGHITFKETEAKTFLNLGKKMENSIIFTTGFVPKTATESEARVFHYLREAAGRDTILQEKELEKYAKKNYDKYFELLTTAIDEGKKGLFEEKLFSVIENKGIKALIKGKKIYLPVDGSKEKLLKILGFKKYLKDYTLLSEREVKEVALWKDYLVFAGLFGIAKEVAKQFENLNPEIFAEMQRGMDPDTDFYSTLAMINIMSNTSSRAATSAQNAANASSSGGGGGASFGGGGGFSGGGSGGGGR